jgi:hypothetical protein
VQVARAACDEAGFLHHRLILILYQRSSLTAARGERSENPVLKLKCELPV